jgi:menaquinol-cytochrome c reductase iron-sulfur subunit
MDSNQKNPHSSLQDEQNRDVIVISRRSFFGALLGVGGIAMSALLAVPVLRFVLYPLYSRSSLSKWSKVGLVDVLPPAGSPPVKKEITFHRLDGWRETVTTESVYVERTADGKVRILSSICPHLGCTVQWRGSSSDFFCPCHGSVFSRVGKHLAGPSRRGMDPLPHEQKDGDLLVHFEFFREDVPNREVVS